MAKKVYGIRILVETGEHEATVEGMVRGWGEATFEGFVLLDLAQVRTSVADIDTLAHTLARMIKSQEHIQESLLQTIDTFAGVSTGIQQLINYIQTEKPDEAVAEEEEVRADLLDLSEKDAETEETTVEAV